MCVSTVKASSVWIRWDTREQINNVMLKTLNSCAKSLHRYFRMQHLTFQLAALSCLHTSGQRHDLTSVSLAVRTWDLHSPLSRRRLCSALHREPICFCFSTHERVAIKLGKAKVSTNFSIEPNP